MGTRLWRLDAPGFRVEHRRGRDYVAREDVDSYVAQATAELAEARRVNAVLAAENESLKRALRNWQSKQAPTATEDGYVAVIPREMDRRANPYWPDQPTGEYPSGGAR